MNTPIVLAVILAALVPGCMGQALGESALLGIAFGLIAVVIVGFIVLGIVLMQINKRPEKHEKSHPHIVLRFLKFFFQYLFIELLSIPFTVAGIIALINTNWAGVNVFPISVAFYIFIALKYSLVIFIILYETIGLYHLGPHDQEKAIMARYQGEGKKTFAEIDSRNLNIIFKVSGARLSCLERGSPFWKVPSSYLSS